MEEHVIFDPLDFIYRMYGMPKALTAFAGQALLRAHGCAYLHGCRVVEQRRSSCRGATIVR
jgi:hypothetical protein